MEKKVIVACAAKVHAFNLAEQLAKKGMLHSFLTTYAYQKNTLWRRFVSRIDQEEIPVKHIRTFLPSAIGRKLLDIPWFWNELFDRWVAFYLSNHDDYDLFIGWSGMCSHSLRAAKRKGKKTIVVRGSAHIEVQNELLKEEYTRLGLPFSLPKKDIAKELKEYAEADYINVLSSFSVNTFLERGIAAQKLLMNPLGVNLMHFQPQKKAGKPTHSATQLIYLGHLTHRKGIHYILEAHRLLEKRGVLVHTKFIGGIGEEIVAFLAQNPPPSNCSFLGHIHQKRLPENLSLGSIGLVPSIEDGFAQVIPQMLACGIPVIASENTSGTDIIENGVNGYVIPIRSAEAIADHVEYLIKHPEHFEKMIEQARSSMVSHFSWEDYGNGMEAFIKRILE